MLVVTCSKRTIIRLLSLLPSHFLSAANAGISAPRQSFDRWLLERKALDEGGDPLLPQACRAEMSPCLKREITVDIPVRHVVTKSSAEADHAIHSFCFNSKRIINSR